MLIPSLIDRVANDRPLTLQGNDGLVFPPTHVDDAAAVTIRALKAPSGAFDVCGPSAISMRDLGAIIGNALGRSVRFEIHDGPSPYLVGHQPVDFLGSSSITPEDGVAALCRGDW